MRCAGDAGRLVVADAAVAKRCEAARLEMRDLARLQENSIRSDSIPHKTNLTFDELCLDMAKFHYADFPVTSATSPQQTRDVPFTPTPPFVADVMGKSA